MILGLPTDSLPVTGMILSNFEVLEAECLHQFGIAPRKSDCRGSCIKLTWLQVGTILFGDKSGTSVHWKFLPLLRDFASIGQYSWGSACLALLYRALCRASHFDCQARLGFVLNRKALDDLQEGQFVWVAYAVDRIDSDIIPADIYMHSGVSHHERNLDKAHGEVLTGPKNLNWATATTHSFWEMHWINRYNHVLTELLMASQNPLDIYMYYGNHLNLSDFVVQEDVEGNQVMDDDNQGHEAQSPPPPPPPPPLPPQEQL
ncbi:uncharacterized protein DS421_5g137330 [Arachis hypogaea]|nr:uncharacterized protein DS421_5g137330 [Arachis hypogaea]